MPENHLLSVYRNVPRWVNWKMQGGRKLPVNPKTGGLAASDNARTWGTYKEARSRSDKIGIMLGEVQPGEKGWSVCGIDLDGCLVNGKLTPEAKDVVHRIHRYTEVSPSGKGVHILFTLNNNVVEKLKADFGI